MQILLNSAHFSSKEYAKRKHSRKLQQSNILLVQVLIVSVGRHQTNFILDHKVAADCRLLGNTLYTDS